MRLSKLLSPATPSPPVNFIMRCCGDFTCLLLMMVAEERGLLFTEAATPRQRKLYSTITASIACAASRERRALADSSKHDLWRGLRSTFRLLKLTVPVRRSD